MFLVFFAKAFLQRPQLGSDLIAFADEHHSAAIIMMFLHTVGSEGDIVREMAIYSQNEGLRQLVSRSCKTLLSHVGMNFSC
jgi:hypothetical protein